MRVLSGSFKEVVGPFQTVQDTLILDVALPPGGIIEFPVALASLNTVLCHVHGGGVLQCDDRVASINGTEIACRNTAVLDASHTTGASGRSISMKCRSAEGVSVLVLAGAKVEEPLSWRGTFTLTSESDLVAVEQAHAARTFPPVRTSWDYKRLSDFPMDHPARLSCGFGSIQSEVLSDK